MSGTSDVVTSNLERRVLGRTGLEVSMMGLGSGGPSRLGQRSGATVESVSKLIATAFDLGIDFFDTAPGYGSSEELLGKTLSGFRRAEYTLSTKFNPVDREGRVRHAADLRRSLERSLDRLRTDHVDLFLLHAVSAELFDAATGVFVEPLQDVVDAGLVRYTGITEAYVEDHAHETIRRAIDRDEFDVVMVGYNLLSPSAEQSVLPRAVESNVGVIVMCAVRGVISDPDKLRAVIRNWKTQGFLDPSDIDDEAPLDWLLDTARSITAAAYRFAAGPEAVGCVLTGTASPEHLVANVADISGPPLPRDVVDRLRSLFGKVGLNVSPRDATR